jgi:hypothetical protein
MIIYGTVYGNIGYRDFMGHLGSLKISAIKTGLVHYLQLITTICRHICATIFENLIKRWLNSISGSCMICATCQRHHLTLCYLSKTSPHTLLKYSIVAITPHLLCASERLTV